MVLKVIIMTPDEKNSLTERYDWAIALFFKGGTHWESGRKFGHIWVAKHNCSEGTFETLTVEPPEGGQYEIAVRIKDKDRDSCGKCFIYRGYKAGEGFLRGVNTGGH